MKGKGDSKWETFVKICLCLAISLYWISGAVLICIGVSIQVKLRETFAMLNEAALGVPVILTLVGVLIILVSTFGAVALLKHNFLVIKVFTGVVLALLVIEIIVGASAYAYREKLHHALLTDFLKTLDKYNGELQITKGVDNLQTQFQCCGATSYTDWLNTTFGLFTSSVPRSCCKVPVESCVMDLTKYAGCVEKLKEWAEAHMAVFGGVGIFVGLAQLTGILFCYLLLKELKENYARIE